MDDSKPIPLLSLLPIWLYFTNLQPPNKYLLHSDRTVLQVKSDHLTIHQIRNWWTAYIDTCDCSNKTAHNAGKSELEGVVRFFWGESQTTWIDHTIRGASWPRPARLRRIDLLTVFLMPGFQRGNWKPSWKAKKREWIFYGSQRVRPFVCFLSRRPR